VRFFAVLVGLGVSLSDWALLGRRPKPSQAATEGVEPACVPVSPEGAS